MPKKYKNTFLIINRPAIISYETPEKIAYQYMNKIAIDEETEFEIKAVLELREIPVEQHETTIIERQKKQGLVPVHKLFGLSLFENLAVLSQNLSRQ